MHRRQFIQGLGIAVGLDGYDIPFVPIEQRLAR